jgi:hypothetical protein
MNDIRSIASSQAEYLRICASRDDSILDEYARGVSTGLIAERFDMKPGTVRMAVWRAAQRGDDRAFARSTAPPSETRDSWSRSATNLARRNAILDAWAAGRLARVIAADFNVSISMVKRMAREAHNRGDERGVRRGTGGRPKGVRPIRAADA